MEAIIYNQEGKETGKINLPVELFGLKWNADLVDQVVRNRGNKRGPAEPDTAQAARLFGSAAELLTALTKNAITPGRLIKR